MRRYARRTGDRAPQSGEDSFLDIISNMVGIMIILVMVAGLILMTGGGSKDPAVFNYAMFDFRRLVAAPVVLVCGIIIEIIAIMGRRSKKSE